MSMFRSRRRTAVVILCVLVSAACATGTDDEVAPLESAPVTTGVPQSDAQAPTTDAKPVSEDTSPMSTTTTAAPTEPITTEGVTPDLPTTSTTITTPTAPASGAPQALLDYLEAREITLDDYLEWYPQIDLAYRQPPSEEIVGLVALPASYVQPPGWQITADYVDGEFDDDVAADPREEQFIGALNSRTIDGWSGAVISPEILTATTEVHDLSDGLYAVTAIGWDAAQPDSAMIYVSQFVDCGDLTRSFDTYWCSDYDFRQGEIDALGTGRYLTLPLDDRLSVVTTAHVPCEGDQWLCWTTYVGGGVAFGEMLSAFYSDLNEYVVRPVNDGLGWEELATSLAGGPFASASPKTRELVVWHRQGLPSISLKVLWPFSRPFGIIDDTTPAVFPPVTYMYAYDPSSADTCQGARIVDSGNDLPDGVSIYDEFPCVRSLSGRTGTEIMATNTAGSVHVVDGRVGLSLSWESYGG